MEACLQNTGDLKTGLLKWIGHAREESKKGNTERNQRKETQRRTYTLLL
jgi:hypothetical protein